MRALKIVAPRKIEFYERPEPNVINPHDVKIQVKYVGICVDDMPFFRRDKDMYAWGVNLIPLNGHEMTGIVVELGEAAKKTGLQIGDRVSGYAWNQCGECYYCKTGKEGHCLNIITGQGTLAEYIVWHSRQLIKLPDSISLEEGCLTDPIGFAMHGADRANINIGDKVLIIGGTVNALLMLQMVRMQGATRITLMDSNEESRKLALTLGADYVIDPQQDNPSSVSAEITDGLGYDVVFETSGDIAMLVLGFKLLARQGKVVFSNLYGIHYNLPISISEMYMKEASLIPYYMAPYALPRIRNIMEKLELKPLITKIYDFDDALMAYEDTETGLYPHILVQGSD